MTPKHAAGLQRIVDALRERDAGGLAASAVVHVVKVQRRDRGVRLRDDTGRRELAVHGLHVAEPIVALPSRSLDETFGLRDEELGILREHLAARPDGRRQHFGEPAAGRDHVDDGIAGLIPRNCTVSIGLRAASRSLSSAGRAGAASAVRMRAACSSCACASGAEQAAEHAKRQASRSSVS